jgi:hypothetical protein
LCSHSPISRPTTSSRLNKASESMFSGKGGRKSSSIVRSNQRLDPSASRNAESMGGRIMSRDITIAGLARH